MSSIAALDAHISAQRVGETSGEKTRKEELILEIPAGIYVLDEGFSKSGFCRNGIYMGWKPSENMRKPSENMRKPHQPPPKPHVYRVVLRLQTIELSRLL